MSKPRLDPSDLVVATFEPEPAPEPSFDGGAGGRTPDTGCFHCPIEFTRSCDVACF